MGERGPIPEPTAIKRAKGVRPHRINEVEPCPPRSAQVPVPPAPLDEDVQAVWDRLAPPMHAAGLLTPLDVDQLAVFCSLVVMRRRLEPLIVRHGPVTHGARNKEVVVSAAWRSYREIVDRQRVLARELGLTPSGRSAIRILPVADEFGDGALG